MGAKKLTKLEAEWVQQVQALLDNCPSKRLGAYTIGDHFIALYDSTFEDKINALIDSEGKDFCTAVEKLDCELTTLRTPFAVHSTAG